MKVKKEKNDENISGLVWAKIRYSPYWPAKLVETPPEIAPTPLNKTCVLFFGTKQFGFVDIAKCRDYEQNRNDLVKIGRGVAFREAIKQVDEYLSDPIKFRSNAVVKPIGRKIKVKTEGGEKVALVTCNQPKVEENHSQMNDRFQEEKQKLIKAYVEQKSENQKITLDLKRKSEECQNIIAEKKEIEKESSRMATELTNLKSEFSHMKNQFTNKTADYEQKIIELQRQKQTLSSQNAQLQIALSQNSHETDDDEDNENTNDVFEVEKILSDEIREERYFHVRWKGYSQKYDTWEREANLNNCRKVLSNYLQLKKSKK